MIQSQHADHVLEVLLRIMEVAGRPCSHLDFLNVIFLKAFIDDFIFLPMFARHRNPPVNRIECLEISTYGFHDEYEGGWFIFNVQRSEEHTSELQSRFDLVCRLLLEKKNYNNSCD